MKQQGHTRKIIQIIIGVSGYLVALCDDGTIWCRQDDDHWFQINTDKVTK